MQLTAKQIAEKLGLSSARIYARLKDETDPLTRYVTRDADGIKIESAALDDPDIRAAGRLTELDNLRQQLHDTEVQRDGYRKQLEEAQVQIAKAEASLQPLKDENERLHKMIDELTASQANLIQCVTQAQTSTQKLTEAVTQMQERQQRRGLRSWIAGLLPSGKKDKE